MQIRSITLGFQATPPDLSELCAAAGRFLRTAQERLTGAGFVVQTTRICTQPAHQFLEPGAFPAFAQDLEAAGQAAGIDYCAAGGIQIGGPWTEPAASAAIVEAILGTQSFFTSLQLDSGEGVDSRAARAAAKIIVRISRSTDQGFGNLRFAGAARCPANVPFFPVAFHFGVKPRFSMAVQWADLLVQAARGEDSLAAVTDRLTASLADWGGQIERLCVSLAEEAGWDYAGLDLTPAPFPSDDSSVAGAIEALGVERMGAAGTLTAVSTLTRAIQALPFRRAGFSGIMLPVLEDSILARRVSEGIVSISELLLYSAVCGTGLDTVPLPGDVTEAELASILSDVATLAVGLDKPLTARLLPVPGKTAGAMTEFTFPFFANGRVMTTKGLGSPRLLDRIDNG